MDDVDAAEAIQARNMLQSGNWITQHLNGTVYLDKAPLKYWLTAGLYSLFGVHDWVARLPTAIAGILLCWLVVRAGEWADSPRVGFYSGVVLATSIGMFLFTRTIIPDIILTLFITLSLCCLFRLLESDVNSFYWGMAMYAAIACAVLTKGLIGFVVPVAIITVYILITRQTARRLYLLPGLLLFLLIAAPWHILATLQNPPVFDLTLNPGAHFGGKFRGFFWFYFINEQLLRFLNQRWPHDYNTVPRLWFWLYHILWFYPWSLCMPALSSLTFKPVDRPARMRLLALCAVAFVMVFFTFSTTQEYYSMPIYPAVALLLGSALASDNKWLPLAARVTACLSLVTSAVMLAILFQVWHLATPGDIFTALSQHPDLYTLSLGHMADLTLPAFAYLRLPLLIAGMSFLGGGIAIFFLPGGRAWLAVAAMLVVFFQASRLALIVFDPYLSSFAIAQKLNQLPPGKVIVCGKFNPLSSVFFYSPNQALQNDPDLDILEYGSLAPGAPPIAISDAQLKTLWNSHQQIYIVAKNGKMGHLQEVLGTSQIRPTFHSGDKYLVANLPQP
jgi:4-amino-4-deoxy-L-arabinose transferase-like glycosyltransferase